MPLELVEKIVYFSIRVRTFKRALRLRLVNRQFRNLVEDDMFRTRLLDEYVGIMRAEIRLAPASGSYRPPGRDSAWLAFLKRYLAYRVFSQPNLDPQCPESLIHRAAACLSQMLDDNSEEVMLGYIATLCQVGFWEHCCCFNRYSYHDRGSDFIDDSNNYIDSTPNTAACYDGDGPLKRILLDAAIYLGHVELAKKVYTMEPIDGYYFDPDDAGLTDAVIISEDRVRLAVAHGGLDMFRLVNQIELGIETTNQYREICEQHTLMEYILGASENSGSATLIHFLLDIGMPWDAFKVSSWSNSLFPPAMMYAPLPEIFKRLAAMEGPETNALNARSVRLCCRSEGMIVRLNHSAAANNLVMVRYLLDQGGARYLNNTHTCSTRNESEPLKKSTGFWEQWLLNPLVRAVEVGNAEMVALMLAHGADPNHHTVGTPLMAAGENSDMFELLMVNGAVITTPDTGGRAMALVKAEGLETMRDLLMSQGVEPGTVWHYVPLEEEFVLGSQYSEIAAGYGAP
ncbi:hypothetical protein G7Y89_g11153 [Cudoniella acicularis]|uniref:Uncharacterized protein n=1 Tax=Cudoniella acicularis TaxID=354080 RepID=A0A8H4RBE4_9HELO|nr:hypothetical protein G7Y89_g11153 [Cudoniella acicularis]